MQAAEQLLLRNYQVDVIRVDQRGVCELSHFHESLGRGPTPRFVSVMYGNNETGVRQPVNEMQETCRQQGIVFHCDAVQAVSVMFGRGMPLACFDALTLAGHKFGGPVGIGALIVGSNIKLEPQLYGGFQQGGLRPGTESVPMAFGFVEALATVRRLQDYELKQLRDWFEARLRHYLDDLVINGEAAERLPHISNIAFIGCDRQQLFLALDFAGVYCSTGSACASGSSEPSPVLRAMGLPDEVISSSLRFSFGSPTTRDEIDESVERITSCVKRLRSQKSARK
jgi:cysteine desulfurase